MEKAIRLPVHRDVKRPFEADGSIALVRRAAITAGLGVIQRRQPEFRPRSRKAAMSLICVSDRYEVTHVFLMVDG